MLNKYDINKYFFDSWTPNMAYVLGFFFADGYMNIDKSYRISFSSNDRVLLEDIACVMNSNHLIKRRTMNDCWRLELYSKYLYNQLTNLGGFTRKSKLIVFPHVPSPYLRDFIRGYFDGDGSVFFVKYLSTKDKVLRVELRSNFTSGSEKFLLQLRAVLNKVLGLPLKELGYYNAGQSIKLGYGTRDTKKLLTYLYYNNFCLGLQRKARFVNY